MDPDYLPRLIELMRANDFTEAEIVDVTSRLVGPHPADLVIQREVIATAALAGLLANGGWAKDPSAAQASVQIAAKFAVETADVLIAELAK